MEHDRAHEESSGDRRAGDKGAFRRDSENPTTGDSASDTAAAPSTSHGSHRESSGDDPQSGTHSGTRLGEKVRGLGAQVHGLGEAFRGNVGAALDSMSGDTESKARYEEIARRGKYEIHEKQFAPKFSDDKD